MKKVRMLAAVLAVMAGQAEARVVEKLAVLKPGAVVLMQGDSITEGGRWPGDDFNHIMGQDYAYILAGEIGLTYPERNLSFINRAVSGNTATDLAARWQADTIDLHPDVLSIMVGVNDTFYGKGETLETYEAVYDKLLFETIKAFPNIKIVLGEPFVMPVKSYADDYAAKRAELEKRQAVVKRLGAKYHLPVVLYQDAFDAALSRAPANVWSWDGVHPTYAGHALMAETWLKTVDAFWNVFPPASIGTATMASDGTITLQLWSQEENGTIAEGVLSYRLDDPQYKYIRDHLGGLKRGESKPIPPFTN